MDTPSAALKTNAAARSREARRAELSPGLKRERLLRRVMDAGKRLPQNSTNAFARLR